MSTIKIRTLEDLAGDDRFIKDYLNQKITDTTTSTTLPFDALGKTIKVEIILSEGEFVFCSGVGIVSKLFQTLCYESKNEPRPAPVICECGKEKHKFISHSAWCPKVLI